MALSENQPPDEPTRTRGSGGDVQSKGIPPDPDAPDRSEEAGGVMQGEGTGGAKPNEE